MAQIKTIDGEKYSRESFEDYKLRAKTEIHFAEGIHYIDIYTTETNRTSVWNVLFDSIMKGDATSFNITHWATQEQDDLTNKFINEWLNDV